MKFIYLCSLVYYFSLCLFSIKKQKNQKVKNYTVIIDCSYQLIKEVDRHKDFLKISLDKMRVFLLFLVDFSYLESNVILRLGFFLFRHIFTLFLFPLESFHLAVHLKSFGSFFDLFDDLI